MAKDGDHRHSRQSRKTAQTTAANCDGGSAAGSSMLAKDGVLDANTQTQRLRHKLHRLFGTHKHPDGENNVLDVAKAHAPCTTNMVPVSRRFVGNTGFFMVQLNTLRLNMGSAYMLLFRWRLKCLDKASKKKSTVAVSSTKQDLEESIQFMKEDRNPQFVITLQKEDADTNTNTNTNTNTSSYNSTGGVDQTTTTACFQVAKCDDHKVTKSLLRLILDDTVNCDIGMLDGAHTPGPGFTDVFKSSFNRLELYTLVKVYATGGSIERFSDHLRSRSPTNQQHICSSCKLIGPPGLAQTAEP